MVSNMFHVREFMVASYHFVADPELQDSRMLLHLQKFLSGLQVMSVHIQAYSQEEKEFRCHNGTPPLCVVLSSNPTTKQELTVYRLQK